MKNRAYAQELRAQRVVFFKQKIKQLITRASLSPFEVDYSEDLEKLHKEFPKEKGIILLAEREVYGEIKNGDTSV
jgi:hypothetical protein